MVQHDDNFFQHVAEKFNGYQADSPADLYTAIKRKFLWASFLAWNPVQLNIFYLAFLCAGGAALAIGTAQNKGLRVGDKVNIAIESSVMVANGTAITHKEQIHSPEMSATWSLASANGTLDTQNENVIKPENQTKTFSHQTAVVSNEEVASANTLNSEIVSVQSQNEVNSEKKVRKSIVVKDIRQVKAEGKN